MSSDSRSSDDSGSDGESKRRPGMVGFMFGNVDRRMQLQDDYLDEVRCSFCSDYMRQNTHGCYQSIALAHQSSSSWG